MFRDSMFAVTTLAVAIFVVGCGGDRDDGDSGADERQAKKEAEQIDKVANTLEGSGVKVKYAGYHKVLHSETVGVSIGESVVEIPVDALRDIPIPITVAYHPRIVTVAHIRALSKLPKMISLGFYKSRLSSDVLRELSTLHNLCKISIDDCDVEVDKELKLVLPPRIRLIKLEKVKTADKFLAACTPDSLRTLESLELYDVCISALGMRRVASASALKVLLITAPNADDSIMPYIGKLSKLERLTIDSPRITDAGFAKLQSCRAMKQLFMPNAKLTDSIIPMLSSFPELQVLGIENTDVSSEAAAKALPRGVSIFDWSTP